MKINGKDYIFPQLGIYDAIKTVNYKQSKIPSKINKFLNVSYSCGMLLKCGDVNYRLDNYHSLVSEYDKNYGLNLFILDFKNMLLEVHFKQFEADKLTVRENLMISIIGELSKLASHFLDNKIKIFVEDFIITGRNLTN